MCDCLNVIKLFEVAPITNVASYSSDPVIESGEGCYINTMQIDELICLLHMFKMNLEECTRYKVNYEKNIVFSVATTEPTFGSL